LRDLATFIYRKSQGFEKQYYVVDVRQSHTLNQTFKIIELLGHAAPGEAIHVSYGFLTLPEGAMSTRKGNKERIIPLNVEVAESLRKYLTTRPEVPTRNLFVSRLGNALGTGSVYHLIKRYLKEAGIKKEKVGVHSLRHTFGASLLNSGANLVVIQELLGHRKLETTRRYLHINNVDLRNAVDRLVLTKQP
jgi:site-specific recombinase XerD